MQEKAWYHCVCAKEARQHEVAVTEVCWERKGGAETHFQSRHSKKTITSSEKESESVEDA